MNSKERLEQYVKEDVLYQDYLDNHKSYVSDFDRFCIEHCQDIRNILEENERLKRQLEELMKTNNVLTQELMKDSDIKQDYLTTCCGISIGDIPSLKYENDRYKMLGFKHLNDENNKLINQQKEFEKYLEKEINLYKNDIQNFSKDYKIYYLLINELQTSKKKVEEILLKYEEIIGGEK